MRQLLTEEWIMIPAGIECHIKSRVVSVKGPKGEIKKDFSHIACELQTMKQATKTRKGTYIRIRMWFGTYKNSTSVNTLASLIKNMMTGCSEVSFTTQTLPSRIARFVRVETLTLSTKGSDSL